MEAWAGAGHAGAWGRWELGSSWCCSMHATPSFSLCSL